MAEQHSLTQDYATPYKFNGKELDSETGLYYYGARYYDPRASIWLSTDPLMEKYPNVNPYVYCMQNPIKYIDPDGKDFYLGGNVTQALQDLYSIVGDEYKSLLSVDNNGKVGFNREGINEKALKNDAGLLLIASMVESSNKFLYEVKETGNEGLPLASNFHTIENLSIEPRMEHHKSGQNVKDGFQGQVIIHPNLVSETHYMDKDDQLQIYIEPRGSTVFHELQENYERTENHLKYQYTTTDRNGKTVKDNKRKGAHDVAIDKARNLTPKAKNKHGKEGQSTKMYIKDK